MLLLWVSEWVSEWVNEWVSESFMLNFKKKHKPLNDKKNFQFIIIKPVFNIFCKINYT